jgi:hypothetical protein
MESRYDNDALVDYPVMGMDWNQTNAYCAKARLGAGWHGPSSDSSHACLCN